MGIFGFFSSRPKYEEVQPSNNAPASLSSTPEPSSNVAVPSNNAPEPSSNVAEPSSNVAEPSSNVAEPSSNVAKPSNNFESPSFNAAKIESTETVNETAESSFLAGLNPTTRAEIEATIMNIGNHILELRNKISSNAWHIECGGSMQQRTMWKEQNVTYRAEIKKCEERITEFLEKYKQLKNDTVFGCPTTPSTKADLENAMWEEVKHVKSLRFKIESNAGWMSAPGNSGLNAFVFQIKKAQSAAYRDEIQDCNGRITEYLKLWKQIKREITLSPSTITELETAISEENSHIAILKKKVSDNAYELREGISKTNEEILIWKEQNAAYREEIKECDARVADYTAKLKALKGK